jgi:hypothetical protein
VPGTQHFLQMEQPEICARIMSEFVDEHLGKES